MESQANNNNKVFLDATHNDVFILQGVYIRK